MSSEAHGSNGYSAAELRDAMTFYGIPGRADIEAIPEVDDLRGDGVDAGTERHGENLGDVNAHAMQRPVVLPEKIDVRPIVPCGSRSCGFNCFNCTRKCNCCGSTRAIPCNDWRKCSVRRLATIQPELAQLTGDTCARCRCGQCPSKSAMLGADNSGYDLLGLDARRPTGNNCLCITWGKGWIKIYRCNYSGGLSSNPALTGDEFFLPTGDGIDGDPGVAIVALDDEPSPFAADYFGGDETLAGEWAENMLAADVFSEDDLYELGWDPFKSIKKAVRPLTKTVKAAAKGVSKVASKATKIVGKIPVIGKVAAAGLRTAGKVTTAGFKLNPVSLLKNPKAAFAAQVAAAKSAVSTAKQTVSVAKTLAKSPVVKAVVGGAAIVFPPIGVPAAAALATAAAVANAIDSKVPAARAAAQKVIENTARLAQSGDKGAEIALSQIATQKQALLAKKLQTAPAGAKRLVFDVSRTGRISRLAL
jgi:hypothetical protein